MVLEGKNLLAALQYLPTPGYPPLIKWLKDLQNQTHQIGTAEKPPTELIVTNGSQDGLCKAIEMLVEPCDSIIVEDYVYAGTLTVS